MRRHSIQNMPHCRKMPPSAGPSLLVLMLLIAAASAARAQNASQQRGFHPGSSYSVSSIETVNNQNGNLMLTIPLASLPAGRGGNPGAGVGLVYNSKLWTSPPSMIPNGGRTASQTPTYEPRHFLHPAQTGGWRYAFRYQLQLLDRPHEEAYYQSKQVAACPDKNAEQSWKLRMHFPDGSTSDFVPQGFEDFINTSPNDGYSLIRPDGYATRCDCLRRDPSAGCMMWERRHSPFLTQRLTYYSTDGRYLRLDVEHDADNSPTNNQWTLYMPDGTRVTAAVMADVGNNLQGTLDQYVYDRNNNFIRIQDATHNGHPAHKLSDQLGRSVIIEYDDPATGGDNVIAEGFGGEALRWTVKWKQIRVSKRLDTCSPSGSCTPFGTLPPVMDYRILLRVVDRIVLPAQAGGLAYSFTYSGNDFDPNNDTGLSPGWGEVASVTVPSGAKATYVYLNDGVDSLRWDRGLYNYVKRKDLTYLQEYDGASAPVTETWHYQIGFSTQTSGAPRYSEVTGPDGGKTTHSFNSSIPAFEGLEFRTVNPDGSMVERVWKENIPKGYLHPTAINSNGDSIVFGGQKPGANTYVDREFTSIKDRDGNYTKTAIKDYDYDKNGNVTRVAEYDWVDFEDVPRPAPEFGQLGSPQGIPDDVLPARVTLTSYYNQTPGASDVTTDSPNSYHKQTATRLRGRVASTEVLDGAGKVLSRVELSYDDPSTTGNLTLQRSWDSTRGPLLSPQPDGTRLNSTNSIAVRNEYDDNATDPALRYGNLTLAVDANGNRTKYTYGAVTRPDGTAFTSLYPTEVVAAEGTGVQRTTSSVYDFYSGLVTKATDEDNQVSTSTTYDALGRPTLVEEADGAVDANGVSVERQTSTEYIDALRRVVVRSDLNATGDAKLASVQHYDQLGRVRLSRRLEADGITQAMLADETAGIKVQTRYVYSGADSYQLASNPYRAATSAAADGEATMGWSVIKADQGGRMVRAETFTGAGLPAPFAASNPNTNSTGAVVTSYDAESVTVTDQAEKQRRNVSDALGRLVQVFEAPNSASHNYETSYAYDALGNLTQVSQGAQTRTFDYSSLSRLNWARNPEVCRQEQSECVPVSTIYEYDANGNLKKKTDARGVMTTYVYDGLNRVTARIYSDGTPPVAYIYGSQQLPPGAPAFDRGAAAGRLVGVTYGGGALGTYTGAYDVLGRPRLTQQVTDAGGTEGVKTYRVAYEYDLAGNLRKQTYPSGRVVTTEYDAAGRLAGVKNQATGLYYAGAAPTDAANRIAYTAAGAVYAMKLGNGLWEHTNYNSRQQPVQIGLGASSSDSGKLRLDYAYGVVVNGTPDATKNNGNVRGQTITVPGLATPFVQSYEYDELNRLKTAEEKSGPTSNWKQVYSYDRFGNRNFDSGTTSPNYSGVPLDPVTGLPIDPVRSPSVDSANNRFKSSSAGQADYRYDEAGNLLCEPGYPCVQGPDGLISYYAYDANNRMKSAGGGHASGGTSYIYDGEGRRVRKATLGGEVTVFVYDAAGTVVAEYSNQVEHKGTRYLTQDHLGNIRVVTDAQGNAHSENGAGGSRHDYFPFGEEIGAGVGGRTTALGYSQFDGVRQGFTGAEHDDETGLDFMQARYYTSARGRFMSVDPIFFQKDMLIDPQRFNLYAYVRNNPLKFIDPKGEQIELTGSEKDRQKKLELLRQVVGKEAGAQLYERSEQQEDGSVKYYVAISTIGPDGRCTEFSAVNNVAAAVARIVRDKFVAQIEFARHGTKVEHAGLKGVIGNSQFGGSPGGTAVDRQTGHAKIFLLDPSIDPGKIPGALMSDGRPLQATHSDVLAHELGHLSYRWGHATGPSHVAAVRLENESRRLRDPNSPFRTGEQKRNDAMGPQPLDVLIRPGVSMP